MKSWDIKAPIFKVVATLTRLRRLNPAISLGSHRAQHVVADVYAFTRRYRTSRGLSRSTKAKPK